MIVQSLEDFLDKKSIRAETIDGFESLEVLGVSNKEGITITDHKKSKDLSKYQLIEEGDFAYNPYRINVGSIGLTPKGLRGLVSPAYVVFKTNENLLSELLLDFLKSKDGLFQINKYARGSVRKSLRFNDLCSIEMPVLDIANQAFILKKKESIKIEVDGINIEIYNQKGLLKKLRQQILQDAIEGKLTEDWREQNPDVEPASELLIRIQAEKQQLIKDKKIKKQKALPAITEDEKPFELPESWKWCKLGKVSNFISGKNFSSSDFKKNNGAKCVKITNAGVQKVIETDDCLPIDYIEKYSKYLIFQEDIIIALTRPYIADGLKVSLCPESYNKSLLNQRVAVIRTFHKALVNEYAYLFLRTDYVLDGYKSEFESKGQQPNLKKEHITHLNIPIPPFEEQKEIIKKVENLFAICDQLEEQITSSQTNAEQLMQSVLKEAFSQESAA